MAKTRQLENLFFKDAESGEVKDLKITTVVAKISKEVGIKKKEGEDIMALVLAGKDLDLEDSDLDTSSKKLLQKAHRILSKVLVDHDKYAVTEQKKADAEKAAKASEEAAAAKLKAAEDKKNSAIMIASAKAHATSEVLTEGAIANMQKAMGKKFVITATGLSIAEGVILSEEDVAQGIATLATSSEGLDNIRATTMWNLGDLVIATEEHFPEQAEHIIAMAVREKGKQKHTIQCAINTCRDTPPDRRFPELSFTHHQEIAVYAKKIKSKKALDKIIEKARAAEVVEIKTPDGRVITQTKPCSVATLRAELQEAAGIVKEPKAPKETPVPVTIETKGLTVVDSAPAVGRGYIYTETATGDAFASQTLSKKALESGQFSVLDLDAMRQLLSDGSEGDQIMQLPTEWVDEVAEAEKPKATKKEKVTKEKKKPEPVKAEPAGESKEDEDDIIP